METLKHHLILGSVVLLAILVLASCAEFSEDECKYLNWQAKGVMDGIEGAPKGRILRYQKTCDKYGVTLDQREYEAGRVEGLVQFCTKENGYSRGIKGRRYPNSCTDSNKHLFLAGYRPASRHYAAYREFKRTQDLANSEYQIRQTESRIDDLEDERDELDSYFRRTPTVSWVADEEEKEKLEREWEENRNRRSSIDGKITDQYRELRHLEEAQRSARQKLPSARSRCETTRDQLISLGFSSPYSCS